MATMTVPEYRTTYLVPQVSGAGEKAGDVEGTTHAGTGLLAGAVASLWLQAVAFHASAHLPAGLVRPADAAGDVLFGVVVAGFALLPDADHPQASFANSAGWLSRAISHLVAVLFGGHRQGMHSAFGIAAVALATEACAVWFRSPETLAGLGVMMTLCIAAGLSAIGVTPHTSAARRRRRSAGLFTGIEALSAGAAISVVMLGVPAFRADLWWLVVLGMALHVFEDALTGHGVAFAWPFSRRRFGGDGRQPAAARRRASGPRDTRPPRQPASPPRSGPSKPMCLHCLLQECGECDDRGCGCPQRVHPARPVRTRKAAVPQPAGSPGTTIQWHWTDDEPPF